MTISCSLMKLELTFYYAQRAKMAVHNMLGSNHNSEFLHKGKERKRNTGIFVGHRNWYIYKYFPIFNKNNCQYFNLKFKLIFSRMIFLSWHNIWYNTYRKCICTWSILMITWKNINKLIIYKWLCNKRNCLLHKLTQFFIISFFRNYWDIRFVTKCGWKIVINS